MVQVEHGTSCPGTLLQKEWGSGKKKKKKKKKKKNQNCEYGQPETVNTLLKELARSGRRYPERNLSRT
jgi:hypothetical protein